MTSACPSNALTSRAVAGAATRTTFARTAVLLSVALLCHATKVPVAVAADASFMQACLTGPAPLPRRTCVCLQKELTKSLSSDEFKMEMLSFTGHSDELGRRMDAMEPKALKSFTSRVAATVDRCPP